MSRQAPNRAAERSDFAALQGVWRSRGYGQLLHIGPQEYTLYEETSVSCQPVFAGSLDELAEHYVDLRVSPARRAFSVSRSSGITRHRFRRLESLPATAGSPSRRRDPVYNFEVFWHTFAEHYALFQVRDVDWQKIHARYRHHVHAQTSAEDLFEIFSSMVRPLRDGHVHLHAPFGHYNAGAMPKLYHRLAKELDKADDSRDVTSYLGELREWLRETIRDQYLQTPSRHSGNRLLEWGQLDDQTGYLAIRAMAGFSGRIGQPRNDFEAVDTAMSQCLADIGDAPRLVVDLRGNGGGYDGVALRLAGYFVDRKRLAFQKAARYGTGYTGKQPVYVEPNDTGRYQGSLFVLTSRLTASAAEVFVLALLQHPQLALVGEPTQGILSDALERHLPNGWFMTLSNELYRAFDGELYEDCGVPPHIEIPFLDQRSRDQGRDPMLDYVLESAR